MDTQEFTDKLRAAARALALGEQEEIVIPKGAISLYMSGKKSADNPCAYIRTTMNRVTEVKERGSIKIKKVDCQDEASDYYGMEIFIVRMGDKKRTVYTKDEVKKIREDVGRMAVRKMAERLLTWAPNLNNYQVGEYETVAKLTAEFAEMVKVNFLNGEEE